MKWKVFEEQMAIFGIGGEKIMASERLTVTLPEEMVHEIDGHERNRSRFVQRAVAHELERLRQEKLRQSLDNPHADSEVVMVNGKPVVLKGVGTYFIEDYESHGYITKQNWAAFELKGLRSVKRFRYLLDAEISSGALRPVDRIEGADALYEKGLGLMRRGGRGVPLVYRQDRMIEAEARERERPHGAALVDGLIEAHPVFALRKIAALVQIRDHQHLFQKPARP